MSPPIPPSSCLMKVRITFAVIGILVGVSVLAVFGAKYHNWNVAVWGLMSGKSSPYVPHMYHVHSF